MKMRIFFGLIAVLIALFAGLLTVSCPPEEDPDPTGEPILTPGPEAPAVLFGDGAFDAGLTGVYIIDTISSTPIVVTGGTITIPAVSRTDIRFDPVDISGYTSVTFTINNSSGGTANFYSYDPYDGGGIMYNAGWGGSFWSAPATINLANVTQSVWDPNSYGFNPEIFDGFGLEMNAETVISRIELNP